MKEISLKDIPIFKRLDDEERDEIEQILGSSTFLPGETLFEEDGPEDCLYVLTSGRVEVRKKVLPRREQLLAIMEAPTVVGEMGLLTEPRSAATVTAKTRVAARVIDRDTLLELLDRDSLAACKILYEIGCTLSERMAETNRSVAEIIGRIEDSKSGRDLDIFQDRLLEEWSF